MSDAKARVYLVFWDSRTFGCHECYGIQYELKGVHSTIERAREAIPAESGSKHHPDKYLIKEHIPDTPLDMPDPWA